MQPEAIRAIMRQARNNPAQEAAAKTRHLNIWVSADEALFSLRCWREGADRIAVASTISRASRAISALDLASRTDLAALALVFPSQDPRPGKTHYTVFARCYINEAAVMEARNASYPGWAAEGYLDDHARQRDGLRRDRERHA